MVKLIGQIGDIFNKDKIEEIKKIIEDFQNLSLIEFFNNYDNKLSLEECEWLKEFIEIENSKYIDKIFNENFKKDFLDLIILWTMGIYDLGLMISGKRIQKSFYIIELVNYCVLEDIEVKDNFGTNMLIESIFQNINIQLEKENIQFLQLVFKDMPLLNTYYFFLFKNIVADKLINFYDNKLFSLKKITCNNYIHSFYVDLKIKKIYSKLNYRECIKNVLNSEIQYLLVQGVKNFLISCVSNIDLEILKIFKRLSNKYEDINLECYVFNEFKSPLLKQCTKVYYLKNKSYNDIVQYNNEIFTKSNFITYFGYIRDFGIVREHIITSDNDNFNIWRF